MPRFRVRLIDVMAVVAFAAIVFGLKVYVDRTQFRSNHVHDAAVAIYLSILSTSVLAGRYGRPRWRPFWLGIALFGGLYLVIGMKLTLGVGNYDESESLVFRCQMALPLGLLCGIAAHWLIPAESPVSGAARPLTDDVGP